MDLVLHIGTEKTGTTFLQNWLYSNLEALSKQGVFLSKSIGKTNNRMLPAFFRKEEDDFWWMNGIKSSVEKEVFFDGFIERFEEEIKEAGQTNHTMIITSEHFHSRVISDDEIYSLSEFCKKKFSSTKVVCYLRPQWFVRKSLFSTAVKVDSTVYFENWQRDIQPDNAYYNYYKIFQRWSKYFNKNMCEFRIFDRNKFIDGDLRKDFLSTLKNQVDQSSLDFELESDNESLKLLMAYAFLGVNKALPLRGECGLDKRNLFFKSILMDISIIDRGEIRDNLANHYYEVFYDSNKKLANEYFQVDDLFERPNVSDQPEEKMAISLVGKVVEEVVSSIVAKVDDRILADKDADILKDVALKFENGQKIQKEEAIKLMELAAIARPGCTFIQRKLKEWKDALIPNSNWSLVYVDSQESVAPGVNAFDGNPDSIWHTEWRNSAPAHPHEIQIDLGATYELESLRYLPRQDGPWGRIKDYAFYISHDPKNWGTPVASGSFANSAAEQTVVFNSRALGRFIRLVAFNEVEGRPITAVAEIDLTGTFKN